MREATGGRLDVAAAAAAAATAAQPMREATDQTRGTWLESIAESIQAAGPELIDLAIEETHLARGRLEGELARTTAQLRMFAAVVREGSYLEAIIDHLNPDATPPVPDLRRVLIPIGPVAVYAASNFPFAFSVAGGDTASALAVGCPVIVKAHPGHPLTSRRTADAVRHGLSAVGAPDGVFGMVEGFDAGVALVQHPAIRAAAFTGSIPGGRALADLAAARPDPIPFHGELGSVNPVVVTAAADSARGDELAAGLAQSFTLGSGQFCTKPGIVFVPKNSNLERALPESVPSQTAPMLTPSIEKGYAAGLGRIASHDDTEAVVPHRGADSPSVYAVDASTFLEDRELFTTEVFGPTTLLVRFDDEKTLHAALQALEGSLTSTLHAEPDEDIAHLLDELIQRSGRVLFQGWPTGVAVSWAQHHGGPWPSTTSAFTSVGATATRRFQRPVAFQDAPAGLLPSALRDENPLGIPQRVDGVLRPARATTVRG
ncbi:aldehyde dehydrogenase (NADP(+)) [Microbacterium sp. PRC9]|uniref:aldehyde dehydrogenase (NADP(+)) n=1 Tax=Microbacterium sp. PRC9 TaxID=2962591 RepID=UPI0028823DF1|nr:aldehyde dehydrogenase (NADP(+)) [Microbacterium sp. PRC9]MDT0144828.1 aldehyde dehydrogenase (NADP(+)) [Microbacterium sp. PRC9]